MRKTYIPLDEGAVGGILCNQQTLHIKSYSLTHFTLDKTMHISIMNNIN